MKQGTLRISVPYTEDPANKPYKTKRLSSPQPKPDTMFARYIQWLIDNKKDRYYVFADTPWSMRRNLPGVQEIQVSRADYVFAEDPANKPYKTKRLSPPQPKPDDLCNRYAEWIGRTGATRYYVFADTADKMRSALTYTAPGLSSLLQEIHVSRADYVFAGVPDHERI